MSGPVTMSAPPPLLIHSMFNARIDRKSIFIPLSYKKTMSESQIVEEEALADTGASGRFIDNTYARIHKLP